MSTIANAIALRNLQDDHVAWKLLRAKNAPAIIAILDAHLGGDTRRRTVAEFTSLVEGDLEDLRIRANFELERSAQAYCDQWRADGYLVRRPLLQSRQETYELSTGSFTAIRFARQMIQPHQAVTQSRLNTIVSQIQSLALATNADEDTRRAALLEERARIDEELTALDAGEIQTLEPAQALEQTREIASLARELPGDFARVRDDFELINKRIYATIVNYDEGYRDVLKDIFDGVDQISQSASGQSFKGFYSLLRDADLSETVQDDIDAILDTPFADELSGEERAFLRSLMRMLLDRSQEANSVMTSFARGLRRFVQNQDYQRERILKQKIDHALGEAQKVLERYPHNPRVGTPLDLTSVSIAPVSRWKLKNPAAAQALPIEEAEENPSVSLSIEELRALARETEIDFPELVENINDTLAEVFARKDTSATISDVLQAHPATQGIASVIGLMVLALDQGRCAESGEPDEHVEWVSDEGVRREATIQRFEFFREVSL